MTKLEELKKMKADYTAALKEHSKGVIAEHYGAVFAAHSDVIGIRWTHARGRAVLRVLHRGCCRRSVSSGVGRGVAGSRRVGCGAGRCRARRPGRPVPIVGGAGGLMLWDPKSIAAAVDAFRQSQDQPAPVENDAPAAWDLVVSDLAGEAGVRLLFGSDDVTFSMAPIRDLVAGMAMCRDGLGESRYGTRLQPDNGRDAFADYLQERLDGVVYLRSELWSAVQRGDPMWAKVVQDLYGAEMATLGAAATAYMARCEEARRNRATAGDA